EPASSEFLPWKYGARQRPREANVPAMPAKKTIQNEQLAARDNAPRRFIRQREPRPSVACKGRLSSGGVSGTPHARPGERLSRVPLGKETQWARQRFLTERPARRVRPYGMRSWKYRITDASVLGIEIANEVRKSGTRSDPIIIGMLSRPFTRRIFDSGQLLRA